MSSWSKISSRFAKSLAGSLVVALIASILSIGNPAQAAYAAPVIATVSPVSGTLTGGELITVTGSNLQYVGGGALGNGIDQYHWVAAAPDGSWLQFRAPDASRTGKVDLSLYGQINVTEPQIYTYTSTAITSINPPVGTFLGGTAVTINGTGFGPMEWGDGSLSVTIGGVPATAVHRVSPTQITAVTGPHALGVTDVVVSFNVVGNSIKYSNNVITGTGLYTYGSENVSPTISSVSPEKGSIAGGQDVTITGKYLRGTDLVNGTFSFGGTVATVKSINADGTSAVVTTPAHVAGQVDVTVTTKDGAATLGAGYQYGPPPTVTGISASSGVTNGGTKVTITGTNFGSAGAPIVKIGGKLALCVKLVNSTTITAATRDNVAGPANVEVTATTGAGSATLTNGYEFKAPATTPNITAISPNQGPVSGGTVVTFTTDSSFPTDLPNVMFGSVCAASVTRVNATTIRATAPANPAGAKNVTLTWNTAYSSKSLGYTYFVPNPPAVASINPNLGWAVGGLSTTITGTGFGNVPGTLKFGTVTATNVTFWSDNMIIAFTPPNTVGAKDISVIPNLSTTPIVGTGLFTYKAPVISNVTPNNGPVAGGTAVTINGDGFGLTGTPTVTFAGKAATNIVRVSPTKITAVVPAGAKGFAKVVVTPDGGGSITNDTAYAYTNELLTPLISDSSPWVGPQSGGITVTVTGKNFIGTDGKKGVLKIAGSVPANVSINSGGTVATFTAPALGPGRYVISIVTNEGTAWQTLYTVFAKPHLTCANIYAEFRNMNPDGGALVRVYGTNSDDMDMWHTYDADGTFPPTVKINGVDAEITVVKGSANFGYNDNRPYFEFKDAQGVLNGGYGYQTLTIAAGNETPITLNNCVYRTASAAITADDRTHEWTGVAKPFSYFGYHAVGERDGDKVVSVGTYTFSGNGYGPSTTPPTAVGEYTVRPSNATMDPSSHWSHYAFAYIAGTYTITGQGITITATCSAPSVYDGTSASYTISGLPAGEVQKSATITWTGADANGNAYGPTSVAPKNAGTYTVGVSAMKFNSGMEVSYDFSYANTTCTIAKRPVQIVAKNQTKTFGDNDPALPWEFFDPANTNLVGSDSISGSLSRAKAGTHAGELVGLYEINTGNLSSNNVNYDIQYSIPNDPQHPGEYGYLIITKKDITITAADKSKIYGNDDPRLTWTASPSSLANGENVALGMTGSLSRAAGEDATTYSIGQGTLDNANYNITFVDGTFTINPRPIRVRFNDKSKVYGATDPTLTAYNEVRWNTSDLGLVFGDTIASIMTGDATRAVGENVGEYAISKGTMASNANYTVTWVNGKFTINKRPVHLNATDTTKVYGEADPANMLDYTEATVAAGVEEGLINGDTISGTAARQAGQDVGDYNITVGTLSAGSNYSLSFSTGKLTITKRPVTIAPDAMTKVYGNTNPVKYTYSLVSGTYAYSETSLVGTISRQYGENVGDYGYILSWSFIYNNPNYSVTIDPTSTNKFSITKRDITITAADKTKQYGQSDPGFTYDFTTAGLSQFGYLPNGQYVYFHGALSRDEREDVGAWDINQGTLYPGLDTDTVDNWNVTYVKGKLTITKRDLDVYAADQEKIYGDEGYPDNSVSLDEGALAFDDAIDGATFDYNVSSPTDAGDYDIIPSAANFSSGLASNYNITYHKGTLTIKKRVVHMNIADNEKFYGEADPTTFTITAVTGVDHEGFVGEDSGSGTPGREPGNNVGNYKYTLGTLTGGSNYTVVLDSGKLIIKKLAVKVQPIANQEKTYGDLDPTYTYSTDIPLPYGESLSGTLSRDEGEDVGTYAFDLNDLDSSNSTNYEVTLDSSNTSTFKIIRKDITVTIDDLEKYYGDEDPAFTYTFSPTSLPNGEVIEVKSGSPSRTEGEDAGDYPISKNDIDFGSNFNATITAGSPKLTIKPRPIEVTADDKTSVYGAASLPDNTFAITDGEMQNGETLDSVSFAYTPGSPVHAGTYTNTPSAAVLGNGGKTANYAFTYVNGSLVISKAKLKITLENANIHWGEPTADFSVRSTEGLVGTDEIGDITYSTDGSTTIATDPGNYVLDGESLDSMDSGSLDDYEVEFVPANYVIDPPFAINFAPARGPIAGGTPFKILGLGFGFNNPTVLFDGIEANDVVLVDSGTITGVTPPHAEGPVNVTLVTDWGTIELGQVFTYFPPPPAPKIISLGPIQGPTDGGTEITMDGSAFIGSDGKLGKVYVDGVLIKNPRISRDGKTIIFNTGAHPEGKVDIRVVTKDGAFNYKDAFEYIPGLRALKVLVLFGGDSSWLQPKARKQLDALANKIRGKQNLVMNVNGWVNRTKKTDIDAKLSADRANRVVKYLQSKGVEATFTINAKGIYQSGNASLNRRAELDISYSE